MEINEITDITRRMNVAWQWNESKKILFFLLIQSITDCSSQWLWNSLIIYLKQHRRVLSTINVTIEFIHTNYWSCACEHHHPVYIGYTWLSYWLIFCITFGILLLFVDIDNWICSYEYSSKIFNLIIGTHTKIDFKLKFILNWIIRHVGFLCWLL